MAKRENNVDLLRVIAAFLITILHVLGQGGILSRSTPGSSVYWTAYFLEFLAFCAVNCFALVTGYVMVGKNIKLKRIISLWFQVLFYSLTLTLLIFIFFPQTRTLKNLVYAFLPVLSKRWWYISAYFGLFFIIPFLNRLVDICSEKTHRKILLLILIGVGIADCVFERDAFGLMGGYSTAWIMLVYLFGAYIKKYNVKEKITAAKSIIGFFAMVVLAFLSKVVLYYVTKSIFGADKHTNIFLSYTAATTLLAAIFLFLFCLNIKIDGLFGRIIQTLSPAALGVYLVHVQPLVFAVLIKNAFVSFANKSPVVMVCCVLVATLAIFIICAAVDLLRIQLFKLVKLDKLSEAADKKSTSLYLRIFKK